MPGAAEPFEAADQVAGLNVPPQGLDVHIEQAGGGRRADRGAASKGRLDRGVLGVQAGGKRLDPVHGSVLISQTASSSRPARPCAISRSTTPSSIRLVPNRQPPGRRWNGAIFNSRSVRCSY
jgi:hypothetical protein